MARDDVAHEPALAERLQPSRGVALSAWLVQRASRFLEMRTSRRGFLVGTAVTGSALAAAGIRFTTRPGTAYAAITSGDCAPDSYCQDGYTEFCCSINSGVNACPPGSFAGGWWRADFSSFCNGTRYYIDCMQNCCGPDIGGGFCAGCVQCQCANGCDTRKVYCNYFRYGQCHQEIASSGPIACRVVSCVPPYTVAEYACSTVSAVDNATAEHAGNCPPPPPPPPPPPHAALLPAMGTAVAIAPGAIRIFVRAASGSPQYTEFDGGENLPWNTLGGLSTSGLSSVFNNGVTTVLTRGGDNSVYEKTRLANGQWNNWIRLGGAVLSDPAAAMGLDGVRVFARGLDEACYTNLSDGIGTWKGWVSLGGRITSEPAVAANASGIIVVARGGDNAIYYGLMNPGWSGWRALGGATTADPAVAADADGFHLFVRGNDQAMWYGRVSNAGVFTTWVSLGGGISSDPAAAVDSNGVHVVIRGNDGHIYHRTPSTPWASFGGGTPASPLLVTDASGTDTHVLVCGTDSGVYHRMISGGTWESLDARIAPVRPLV